MWTLRLWLWVWVLLGVLGVLHTQAEAPVPLQPNFEQDKLLGRWFSVGLASDARWFREKKAFLTMGLSMVVPMADGGLNRTLTFLSNDQCETHTLLLRPKGTPGSYSFTSLRWGSVNDVWVVATDYEDYAMLYTVGTKGPGQGFRTASLYSRTPTQALRVDVKEKFKAFAQARGLAEAVVFLPRNDKCLEGHL